MDLAPGWVEAHVGFNRVPWASPSLDPTSRTVVKTELTWTGPGRPPGGDISPGKQALQNGVRVFPQSVRVLLLSMGGRVREQGSEIFKKFLAQDVFPSFRLLGTKCGSEGRNTVGTVMIYP